MANNVLSFMMDDFPMKQQNTEGELISLDHSYARSWNSHPTSTNARPATLLFMSKDSNIDYRRNEDLIVDVDTVDEKIQPVSQDQAKSKALLDEVERHVRTQQKCIPDEIWDEERINRQGWTKKQCGLFDRMVKILENERVARLSREPCNNLSSFISRKNFQDKSARRVRQLFADHMWDQILLQWLHAMIIEHLPVSYCAAYVEILQALNSKIPNLLQRLFTRCAGGHFKQTIAGESLLALLRRPWDPVAPYLSVHRPRKLPGPPIFIVVASGQTQNAHFPRVKFWYNHLSHLGKLVLLPIPILREATVTIAQQLELTVNSVKAKIVEMKSTLPQRPIILIGWDSGALVAVQTSLIESVSGVVCMGFTMTGLQGPKQLDDPILESKTPILFCVGQFDRLCNVDDLEDFRGHMKCETGLVVVGGADANLHMSSKHKRIFGVTQAMVDRCVVEEIYSFLNHALVSVTTSTNNPSPTNVGNDRKIENSSSYSNRVDVGTPGMPRKSRKRNKSVDEESTPLGKRGPGRPRMPKTQTRPSSVTTSPILEPSQTVTHAAATTATSVLTRDLPQIRTMKPITANLRKSEVKSLGSPTKNPISIGRLGSLSGLSQGSLKVSSPIRDEHRMVNPRDVLGMTSIERGRGD